MIVFIEGMRSCGKTHLINSFFNQNKNPNIIYYKFAFAKYIDELEMRDQESGPGVHYFSISNVLTILELNKTILKDKILIFDRSIFSAYVWSIYRNRMDKNRLILEFEKILNSELYQNCVLFYVTRNENVTVEHRGKDYFDNFENYSAEHEIFEEILTRFRSQVSNPKKENYFYSLVNDFDQPSVELFCKQLAELPLITSSINK